VSSSKILLLDIETAPTLAYVWRMYDENISVNQIVQPTRILCWAAKWVGEPAISFSAEWDVGPKQMLEGIHKMLAAADAVVTYNGDKFDLPKLNGAFAQHDIPSPGPITSIDLYKTVRKLGFQSNKLEFVAPLLGVGKKTDTGGFQLWADVEAGCPKAQRLMARYNKQDTRLLEGLYKKLRPFIKNHPYLGVGGVNEGPACGSKHIQRRGVRRTKSFFVERLHCQDCGSWGDGAKSKVTT